MDDLREIDYRAWALRTAQRARAGVLTSEELLQMAEEMEDMAGSERREIRNCLTVWYKGVVIAT